jgi:uncharacterized protein YqcC (DUF446 family)
MSKLTKEATIILALSEIEKELKNLNLWADAEDRPSDEAFLSQTPFFMDTMEFHQWLQFVLIPKMIELVNSSAPLPKNVSIHPYAQEIYRGKWQEYKLLIQKLMEFDKLFQS